MQQNLLVSSNLNSAYKKVCSSWIPAQVKVIDEITSKIYCGFYENSPESLFSDLKKDISTFLYTARAIAWSGKQINNKTMVTTVIPLLNDLKKHFSATDISALSSNEFQIEVLNEAILSASVVSELSSEYDLEEKFCYTVAMLRHLGRALLAWNYPREFNEALEILNETSIESPLDRILANIFGFSPSTLAGKIVLEMGFDKKFVRCINPDSGRKTATFNRLLGLCHLGEVFAMAHSTIKHPVKHNETAEVLSILTNRLGDSGIKKIYTSTTRLYEAYSKSYPELYHAQSPLQTQQFSKNLYHKIHLTRLARAAGIEKREASIIISMTLDKLTPDKLVKKLFHQLLPSMGIISSLVYTVSPIEETLIPIFKKGVPSFIKPEDVSVYPTENRVNLIRDCFVYSRRHLARGITSENNERIFILHPFPEKQPIGVLYLEGQQDHMTNKDIEHLAHFTGSVLEYLHGIVDQTASHF